MITFNHLLADILAEAAKYGNVTTSRIYGDWTTQQKSGWRSILTSNAIQPTQQFSNVPSKNSADIALVIDAMDLLHAGTVQGFCIVSSDSDFTRLATRIREQGLFVMGIGRQQTPKSLVNACEVFIYTEILTTDVDTETTSENTVSEVLTEPSKPIVTTESGELEDWTDKISRAIQETLGDDGWALLSAVGVYVRQLDSAFDPRRFGHTRMTHLLRSREDLFELRESQTDGQAAIVSVRLKT